MTEIFFGWGLGAVDRDLLMDLGPVSGQRDVVQIDGYAPSISIISTRR